MAKQDDKFIQCFTGMNEEQKTEFIRRLRTTEGQNEHALAQIMDDMRTMTTRLDDVVKAVCGQPEYGQWGLIQRVEDHNSRIKMLERMGVFMTAALAILALFWDEIKKRLFG